MSNTAEKATKVNKANRLRECAEHSSIKCLSKLLHAKSPIHWTLWLGTLVLGVAVGLYLLCELWITYFSNEVTLSITTEEGARPPFPDVTLCNLNPLWNNAPGWGLRAEIEDVSQLLTYDQYIYKLFKAMVSPNSTNRTLQGAGQELYSVSGYLKHTKHNNTLLEDLRKSFVKKCFWQTESETKSCIVIPIITPTNGLCYTIRTPPGEGMHVKTRREGLSVVLFLNNLDLRFVADYRLSPFQSYTEGAKVLVHSKGTFPEMVEGFIVPPGSEASVVAKYRRRIMLPEPFSECRNDLNLNCFDHIKARKLWNYTQYACRSLCYQSQIIEKCACLDSTEITFRQLTDAFRFCSVLQNGNLAQTWMDLNCTRRVKEKLDRNNTCTEQCPVPCEREYYTASSNQVPWPHEIYILALYNSYLKSDDLPEEFNYYYGRASSLFIDGNFTEAKKLVRSTDLIQRNFIQLSITMNDAIITEVDKEAVTLSSVFGSLGGILNLWIGFTFVTVMEIVDLFITVVMDKLCSSKLYSRKGSCAGVSTNLPAVMGTRSQTYLDSRI